MYVLCSFLSPDILLIEIVFNFCILWFSASFIQYKVCNFIDCSIFLHSFFLWRFFYHIHSLLEKCVIEHLSRNMQRILDPDAINRYVSMVLVAVVSYNFRPLPPSSPPPSPWLTYNRQRRTTSNYSTTLAMRLLDLSNLKICKVFEMVLQFYCYSLMFKCLDSANSIKYFQTDGKKRAP